MVEDITIKQGLRYASPGGVPLKGDLYRPFGRSAVPTILAVHGGGWKLGCAARYGHWGRWLASRGIALFSINYRLAEPGRPTFPAAVQDVCCALRFLRMHGANFGLDPERIGLMGDSAGAHLASLVALTGGAGQFAPDDGLGDVAAQVSAVVGVYGVYDLLAQWEHDLIVRPYDQITERFIGVSPVADKLSYYRASPFTYATTAAPKCPFLIAWGTLDDIVDWRTQSGRFVTALKQAGFPVRTVPLASAPHFWIEEPIEEPHTYAGALAPKLFRFWRSTSDGDRPQDQDDPCRQPPTRAGTVGPAAGARQGR